MTAAITPASVLLLVLASYSLGRRYGTRVGVAAALLVACSPVVILALADSALNMVVAALWTWCLAAATGTGKRHAVAAGIVGAAAILLHVSFALFAIVPALFLLFRPERTWAQRRRAALQVATPCAIAALAVALLHLTITETGGTGAIGVSFTSFVLLPVLLALVAPVLLPGVLSLMLLASVFIDAGLVAWRLGESSGVALALPAVAVTLVLAVASFDAAWRRSRLPVPTVALAVAAVAFLVLEYAA